uniref:hypothetical protein n=1 Tax=Tenacibaculum soleae TaxID=447689 RepID=UPI0022FFF9AF
VSTLSGIFSKKTAIYKLLFSLEKAMAINDVLIDTKKANAQITSNLAIANMKAVAAAPLVGGLPFTATNTIIAGKETATNNINAGIQIAGIAASAIQGFEEGLYPVQRSQDGKMFNAVYGGNTGTGVVSKPTVFKSSKGNYLAGEKDPELIVDGAAFKRINPDVKNSFMREIARVKGFEAGFYQQQNQPIISVSDTDVVNNEDDTYNAEIITALNRASTIFEKLENDGLVAYLSNDFKTAKKLQESINDYNNFRKKSNR